MNLQETMNRHQVDTLNAARKTVIDCGFLAIMGPCSVDSNRLTDGQFATLRHILDLAEVAKKAPEVSYVARFAGEKPRTNTGRTGIIHQKDGPTLYRKMAMQLSRNDVPIAAEVMDETGFMIAQPHLAVGWIGARNDHDTGPRYLLRPSETDRDIGLIGMLALVKSGQDGSLNGTINAIKTITSEKPESRSIVYQNGIRNINTFANPNVGVILRGNNQRPEGELADILAEEIEAARNLLRKELGEMAIRLIVDISHAHAKWEGGGEEGQLAIVEALGKLMLSGLRIDGIMAESYIFPGNQPESSSIAGLSLTDACIGEAKASELLMSLDRQLAGLNQADSLTNV